MVLGSSTGPRPQAEVVGILGAFSGSILSVLQACLSWACVEPSQRDPAVRCSSPQPDELGAPAVPLSRGRN